ncbi:hypothetical protein VKT23_007498 [Stygiomarasmius scandens]|uniref:Cytochrome P450 n=1 Tax=Marasmiellus scandens TaxID=2682957 RepID=A0ABR1JPC8_9AGAR
MSPKQPVQIFQVVPVDVLVFMGLAFLAYLFYKRSRIHYPPGPRGIPILGNVFQLDLMQPWHSFAKWKQTFGPLVYANMAGQPIIVLNSKKVVEDLLVRRAAKYSDRYKLLVGGYMTGNLTLPFVECNERQVELFSLWRKMRRASETALGLRNAANYHEKQTDESVLLVHDILKKPGDWKYHTHRQCRLAASSSVLSMVYDLPSIQSMDHPILAFMEDMVTRVTTAVLPGAHLVESFPILDWLPDSMARWRREAKKDFQKYSTTFEELYFGIKSKRLRGMEQRASFCANLAENEARHGMSDLECAWLAGTLYGAGQETSTSTLQWFLYIMLLFPAVQRRAQEELDRVVGRSRLPSFADMKHLPYIQAIVNEILRWKTPVPVSIPHASTKDDYYDGYFIPKGTVLFANMRSLHRDPEIYGPDADEFRPERHLNEEGHLADPNNDGHFAYGFGLRVCVGRHVANNFLFIAFATILWAMKIEPIKDAAGNEILPDTSEDFEVPINGVVIRPRPFEFSAVTRFEDAEILIAHEREEIVKKT